jgi:hypothetical protein
MKDARLPAEVTAAMLSGDSLIRALRRWKGLTRTDLAERTKLAQGDKRSPGYPNAARRQVRVNRRKPRVSRFDSAKTLAESMILILCRQLRRFAWRMPHTI